MASLRSVNDAAMFQSRRYDDLDNDEVVVIGSETENDVGCVGRDHLIECTRFFALIHWSMPRQTRKKTNVRF